jgi:ubiquinone/menaquinone biosynthesis C-methylase UbiE
VRVLDVTCGSGNAALAAARCGCRVTGVDYVPGLLERARARSVAEGLPIELEQGDAEALPYPDGSFDAVLSVVGVMFAPDRRAARAAAGRAALAGRVGTEARLHELLAESVSG